MDAVPVRVRPPVTGISVCFFDHRFAGFSCGRWFFAPFFGVEIDFEWCKESEVTGMDVTGNGSASSVGRRKIALKIERESGSPCRSVSP